MTEYHVHSVPEAIVLPDEPGEGEYCRKCRPDLFPKESVAPEPSGYEGHIAIRFQGQAAIQAMHTLAYLDGEDVSIVCSEVWAGEEGWVIVYWEDEGGKHRCPCRHGAVEIVRFGKVEVRSMERNEN